MSSWPWLHKITTCLTLGGALALPLASMANDASAFPTVYPDVAWDGTDFPLILAQYTTGGGQTGDGESTDGQSSRTDHNTYPDGPFEDLANPPADAIGISHAKTALILQALEAGTRFCRKINNPAYTVDCLSDQIQVVAQAMPKTDGYAEARQALLDAAAKLHALARANKAHGKSAARAVDGKVHSSRLLTPVDNVAEVNAQAAGIMQDTRLVLLRSSTGSNQRRLAYTQIAAVVDSTKVLLRSA